MAGGTLAEASQKGLGRGVMAFARYEVRCTWHETREPYTDAVESRDGPRVLERVRAIVADHDVWGRSYDVVGFDTRGRERQISAGALARMG